MSRPASLKVYSRISHDSRGHGCRFWLSAQGTCAARVAAMAIASRRLGFMTDWTTRCRNGPAYTESLRAEYEQRLALRHAAAETLDRRSQALGVWRLAVVVIGGFLTWWNYWLLPIPVAAFVALLVIHERIARKQALAARAEDFYRRGLDRLDGRWSGAGETGQRFVDPDHPYSADLDIFGKGSLFQLVCGARTSAGEATLASWLSQPAAEDEVRSRQAGVDELRPHSTCGKICSCSAKMFGPDFTPTFFGNGGPPHRLRFRPMRAMLPGFLSVATVIALAGYFVQMLPFSPFLLGVLLEIALLMHLGPVLTQIFTGVELPAGDLRLLADVLERFEREQFQSPLLAHLRQRLESEGLPASRQIARLRRIVEYHDWGRNQMFAPIALVLLWHAHLGFAVERWRVHCGRKISEWIEAVGEIEALSSIAGYASEHPEDTWPELVADGPLFDGQGIAHPLLAAGIRNDLRLDKRPQAIRGQRVEHVR